MHNKVTRSNPEPFKPAPPCYPTHPLEKMEGWIFQKKTTGDYYILARCILCKFALISLTNGNRSNDPSSAPSEVFGQRTWITVDYSLTVKPNK